MASSLSTQQKLEAHGIRVLDLNDVSDIPIYIDGADEVNNNLQLIKGGGGALTREKIIAGASKKFLCIVDDSKIVDMLGKFPLPIEVLPMARSYVAREIIKYKGMDYNYNIKTKIGIDIRTKKVFILKRGKFERLYK